jgi:outer membrane beta-barrel protein
MPLTHKPELRLFVSQTNKAKSYFSRLPKFIALIALLLSAVCTNVQASPFQINSQDSAQNRGLDNPDQIDPNIERRSIDEFDIDSENIEIGVFAGIISIEDFSSDVTAGLRLTYHINENLFVEASYAQATAGETSFEVLSGGLPFLTEEQRDYTYYDVSAAYNFNGEVFFTDNWVFNTDFFLILGAGSTEFGGDERFTVNAGAGYRILVTDYLSVRFDVRDYVFNSDIIGPEKSVHNLTFTLSTSFFF